MVFSIGVGVPVSLVYGVPVISRKGLGEDADTVMVSPELEYYAEGMEISPILGL